MTTIADNTIAITVVGAALSLCVGLALFYASGKRAIALKKSEENDKLVERVIELEAKMLLVNQAVVPISAAFQALIVRELTHFHTPEMDGLMRKLGPPIEISDAELIRLQVLLEQRSRDMSDIISESERDAARMLPMVIKRVQVDLGQTGLSAEPLIHIVVSERRVKARE